MAPHNRYNALHENPNGPGDARPTALSIIQEENLEGTLSDKVILVTGASAGIGVETVRALAATGAKLFVTARNEKKAAEALFDLLKNPSQVIILHMDQSSLASVRQCAGNFLSQSSKLNILICNAGIMATPTLEKTADGFESQFGTNHLSHFLLFKLLQPTLLASSTPDFNSRVVAVASSGHRRGEVQFGNYTFESGNYEPFVAYGQSKTANIYMANEISRRFGSQGLHGLSLHPGGIKSNLQKHMDPKFVASWDSTPAIMNYMKSTEQGAATTVYAAVSKDWSGKGGIFLEDCDESVPFVEGNKRGRGYKDYAFDEEKAKRLWKDSLEMIGLPPEI